MLDKYKVLSPRELNSRYEVYLEQYVLSVHVEAAETAKMAKTSILPAALRYQALLADNVAKLTAIDVPADRTILDAVSAEIGKLTSGIAALESALAHESEDASSLDHATQAKDELIPPMSDVRAAADALEGLVADDLWPLPTYQEMLHIL